MAQKSIPLMNKSGISMYWNNMWDSKINFSKTLNNNLLFNEIISTVLSNNNSFNYNFENYNFYKKKKYFNIFFLKKTNKKKKPLLFFNETYNSKIWLIKLNNWFIIYVTLLKYFQKKKKLKKNKNNNFTNFLITQKNLISF